MPGEVPAGWSVSNLGEVVDQLAGFAFKSEEYTGPGGGVALLRGDNIAPGSVRWNGYRTYPTPLLEGLERYALQAGDVVIAMDRPWIDAGLKAARVLDHDLPAMLVQRVTRLRGSGPMDTGFVWACVRGPRFVAHLRSETTGTAVPHISGKQIANFAVWLPPFAEQRAIASVLGALDDKIESNRRLVVAQRQMRSLQFTNLCRIRFHRVPLGAIAEHVKGTIEPAATPDEDFEQFSIPAFDATGDPEVCLGRTMASGKTPLPSEPVVLISKLNPRIPRVWAPVPSGVGRPVCSPEFLVLRPKPDISHAWLDACVRHDERFYNDLLAGVTGTTGSRQRVKPADVMGATVPDATAEEVAEWTAFAGPMIGREAALDRERRTLTAIRDTLLPKLVSGQIRVPLSDDPEDQIGAALQACGA